jgi:nucleotide-binding universal stress UspA family protein
MAGSEFRVVLATDGSTHARAALAATVAFPWPEPTNVRAVIARRGAPDSPDWPAPVWTLLDEGVERVARETRAALRRRWPSADVVVADRRAAEAIHAEALIADVVVVGSRGLGAIGRTILGSVSRAVVRRSPSSTLVVKRRPRRISSLVLGLDGSVNARRASALVARMPAPRGGRVALVSVVERLRPHSLGLMPASIRASLAQQIADINAGRDRAATGELEAAALQIEKAGWSVATSVRHGVPLEELLAAAAGADVVVAGARGTGGVARLLLGSVADGLLARCPASVLIVR